MQQQLIILHRQIKKPRSTPSDRLWLVLLASRVQNWKETLLILKLTSRRIQAMNGWLNNCAICSNSARHFTCQVASDRFTAQVLFSLQIIHEFLRVRGIMDKSRTMS
ncbi:hypothetical protein ANRL1_00110 [Anaerolineae bacterium]|nr:hypothetical protein ANRL1_00110 [Anaerolineae bacterium]